VLISVLALAGCQWDVLAPAGPVSGALRTILLNSVAIMLAIVVPVLVVTPIVAWWYRESNTRAQRFLNWEYSGRLELIIWSIPALVVLFLGGLAWISSHDLDPAQPLASPSKPLQVEVISLDWKWLFIYPKQGVASVNRLVIPAGVPVHFRLTSATVWNVFWVPRLGSMLYCMYGMAGDLNLQADHVGVYRGGSAMFSGDGFATMYFDTEAVTADQFSAWTDAARSTGPVLDASAYRALLVPQGEVAPYTYRTVAPKLFDDVVQQRLPPGEGAAPGEPNTDMRPTPRS